MPPNGRSGAETIRKCIQLIEVLARAHEDLGVSEIGSRVDMPKATVHRMLTMLMEENYVDQDPGSRKYRLGLRFLHLGHAVRSRLDVRAQALPVMRQLQAASLETITLVKRLGHQRVVVEVVESPQPIREYMRVGEILPIYAGAAGKVLLAYVPDDELSQILNEVRIDLVGPNTHRSVDELRTDLIDIRCKGYSTSVHERTLDAAAVSVPVFDDTGTIVAALSIQGPDSRMSAHRIAHELVPMLVEAGRQVSQAMGYVAGKASLSALPDGLPEKYTSTATTQ